MTKLSTKTTMIALAAAALAASLATAAHAADDVRDFRINNLTQRSAVDGAWIAPAIPNTPWVRIDLSSPIGPQASREIGLGGWRAAGSSCYFDVKIRMDNGNIVMFDNVNLCRVLNLNITAA